ncbi:MAG: Glu/Leu/Phe/Val dehydrogenase [Candidatus Hodarchaeota archaeon]
MSSVNEIFDELGPEKVVHFYNAESGMKAILVIDNSAFGTSAGGIRMQPEITLNEMSRLARMMTFKFISYGLPMGGAKSGIWYDPNLPDREKMIIDYAIEMKPFIKHELYYPGPDMGTFLEDIVKIMTICDCQDRLPQTLDEEKFGLPVEETFTGYGVTIAIKSLLNRNNDDIKGKKVAIEGFGKVGSSLAPFLEQGGVKIAAISTINGGIYNEDGLDVDTLINLKLKFGDNLVSNYEFAEKIRKEELFELPVDILIPGARPDVINKRNISNIKAKYVVPAANIPFSPEVIPLFNEIDFQVIPDFIANSGEVLASAKRFAAVDSNAIYEYIEKEIGNKILNLFTKSKENNTSIYDEAVQYCTKAILRKFKRKAKKRKKYIS